MKPGNSWSSQENGCAGTSGRLRPSSTDYAPRMTRKHDMARHQYRDHSGSGSQRQLRVGELVRHALADMLTRGEVHDPVLEGHMITVPEVRMTADLRLATIYVMPLGGRNQSEVLAAL